MAKLLFSQYILMVMALSLFGPGFSPQSIMAAQVTAAGSEQDVQVLTSGPIHEAFAEAATLDPAPGILALKAPQALIEEIPPDQKPEGDVQWIPGYWAWDDERNDYIWVSGIWRVPPPGRQWVPGYWNPVTNGFQWISGYWASVDQQETEYLPLPPESVEVGPSSNAPSADHIWVPGCWVWQYGRYAWRPGYWAAVQPDWIWIPAHYNWTPRGYIFVSGYWDYTVIHRGVLFAPVYFPPRVHLGMAFLFSPGFVINLHIFDDALFLRPRYCHYYFGDYYAPGYYQRGIYPWFSLHARRVAYNPIYAHQRWHHRNDHAWENRLETRFHERRKRPELRPPRSFDQRTRPDKADRPPGRERQNFIMPLDRAGKNQAGATNFQPLGEKERKAFTQQEQQMRAYQTERQSRETLRQRLPENNTSIRSEPNKEKFSRSPIMDRPNTRMQAPPTRYIEPKPNPNVEPLERKNDMPRPMEKPKNWEGGEQKSDARGQFSTGRVQKSGNSQRWSGERRQ